MLDQLQFDFKDPIPARDSQIGQRYRSRGNRLIIVKEKLQDRIILRSLETDHDIWVSLEYPLMDE